MIVEQTKDDNIRELPEKLKTADAKPSEQASNIIKTTFYNTYLILMMIPQRVFTFHRTYDKSCLITIS